MLAWLQEHASEVAWLHEHASEVQALGALVQAFAAVATVILTGALVWATLKYVRLTKTLAAAATAPPIPSEAFC